MGGPLPLCRKALAKGAPPRYPLTAMGHSDMGAPHGKRPFAGASFFDQGNKGDA